MSVSRAGFEVFPDTKVDPVSLIPSFKGHPGGGPPPAQRKGEPWTPALKGSGSADQQFDLHVRNFLDCIKSRQRPIADVEDGHRVATACHLANISLRLGRKIQWDVQKETIANDAEASRMLVRPYRKPWDAVLRSLLG
jgi:hypothetical protein